jgi:RHS repeat-associated protein
VNNQDTPGVPTTVMSYGYDKVGNLLSITDSINGTTGVHNARQYDALNRLTVNSQGNKRVDYGYNAIVQVTNKKRFSDTTGTNLVAETNHTFDSINRLTDITHSKGATNIATYTQSYDANSRITGITNKDGTAAYNYDETDQLTGADFSFQTDEDYTYDSNGNRTNSGYVTRTNNRLLEDPKYRFDYDLVGNRTKRTDKATSEVTEYAWDIRDRLTGITVKNAGGTVTKSANYKYDVYDQRISKTVDPDGAGILAATTEKYVYGSNQNIALEFDGSNNLTHRYLFGDGIDQIEADESNGTVLWGLVDHLGSVRDVVDNSGTVRNHISYDSFGNITAQTDSSVVFRYGYTGREFDKESGQYYYRSRYFDPTVGKFISEDLIGFGGGDSNLNRYVRNRPTGLTDSRGYFFDNPSYDLSTLNSFSFDTSGIVQGFGDLVSSTNYQSQLDLTFNNGRGTLIADATTTGGGFGTIGDFLKAATLLLGVGTIKYAYDTIEPLLWYQKPISLPRIKGFPLNEPVVVLSKFPKGFPLYEPGFDSNLPGIPTNLPGIGKILESFPTNCGFVGLPTLLQSKGDIQLGEGFKIPRDVFHPSGANGLKKDIINDAAKAGYKVRRAGKNPDIQVKDGKIILQSQENKNVSIKTDIPISNYPEIIKSK